MYSRELLKGILKPIILKLLSENERMYGYEIVQKVKSLSGDKILIKEGSLYPALHILTKEGHLAVETKMVGKRIRKYYRLTNDGKAQVRVTIDQLLDFTQTLTVIFKPKAQLT